MKTVLTIIFDPEEVRSEHELRLAVVTGLSRFLQHYAEEIYRQLTLPGFRSVEYTFDLDLGLALAKGQKDHGRNARATKETGTHSGLVVTGKTKRFAAGLSGGERLPGFEPEDDSAEGQVTDADYSSPA